MMQWGHVLQENFPTGAEGARWVKEELSKVKGMLVEMLLQLPAKTNIQIEDPMYNIVTR